MGRRADDAKAGIPEPASKLGKFKREVREGFDVYAQTMTTLAQTAEISFARGIEIFFDYFAPAVAASNHSLVRRILDHSFYFAMNSAKQAPADANTFAKSLVFGAIDTSSVIAQYLVATPWMCASASPYVSEDLRQRILHSFDPSNPNLGTIAVNDGIRNELAHLLRGSSSFALERRSQVIEQVTKDVNEELIRIGRDPYAARNESLKTRMIESRVTVLMRQQGLNGQFMYDTSTLWDQLPKALGYRTPRGMAAGESFVLARRSALSHHALARALKVAQERNLASPSSGNADAVAILQNLSDDFSLAAALASGATSGPKTARERLQKAYEVRQRLTLLSYEGPIEWIVRNIPDEWAKRWSPEGAQAASLLFRQSLFSYLSPEGMELLKPDPEAMEKFAAKARETAMQETIADHADLRASPPEAAQSQALEKYGAEVEMRAQMAVGQMAREEALRAAAGKFSLKAGWYQQRLEARAHAWAQEQLDLWMDAQAAKGLEPTPGQAEVRGRQLFSAAMAKSVGLRITDPRSPEVLARAEERAAKLQRGESLSAAEQFGEVNDSRYDLMLARVEEEALKATQGALANDLNLRTYAAKLSPESARRLFLSLYAKYYLQAYSSATTERELVHPLSPNAPGAFQAIRQTRLLRNSLLLTRFVRGAESLADDQILDPTLAGVLARSVPLASDIAQNLRRGVKRMPTALAITYSWNWYFWGVHMPIGAWVLFVATSPLAIGVPSQWLTRAFRMNASPVMGGWVASISHNVAYAWVTFLGLIPVVLYNADVTHAFNDFVRDPLLGAMAVIPRETWLATAATMTAGLFAAAPGTLKEKAKGVLDSALAVPGGAIYAATKAPDALERGLNYAKSAFSGIAGRYRPKVDEPSAAKQPLASQRAPPICGRFFVGAR
jgi:hypothetical protein